LAPSEKIFVWHIAFWADKGWNYDVMIILMNFVMITTGGGRYRLLRQM
jgi:hypothetical protein